MAEAVQYLHDTALLCLEHMPALADGLPVYSSGTANLMLDASEGQLAFCPAASSALSSIDVSSGIKGPIRSSLGNTLDSQSSCQGSLTDCSWGSNGTMLLKTHNGGLYAVNSDGAILWRWPGVSAKERTVSTVWFGQDSVAALTTAGNIYTLQSQTGSPPTLFMRRLSAVHRYFRCMAYDEAELRLIIVGDNGQAGKASSSQQLASALSVSIWDVSSMLRPIMACLAGKQQGLFPGGMAAADVQQGWEVAVSPTHLAVTLPSRAIAVYAFSASEQRLNLTFVHSLGSALDPSPVPSLSQPQKSTVGDRLVRCSSNACWWKPDELAFVGPEGCLQIVHVPSAQRLMYVDNHYFLPGSRIVVSQGMYGQQRKIFVLSAIIQVARPLGKRGKKSKAPTVMRRWMLMAITHLSPQDKLASLITHRQWQSALELAQQHQLSPDDIYKSQWVAEGQGCRGGVTGPLASVQDKPWVVQQCAAYIAPDLATQQHVLQYGLDITGQYCQPSDLDAAAEDGNLEASAWWLLQRVQLLEQIDALETFMVLTDKFVEAVYKEFRQHTLEEAAMAAARHASVGKLMLLCEAHPRRLIPGILTWLACLPETVAADSYSHLLTLVSGFDSCAESALQRREADWAEGEAMAALALSMGYPTAACATEHLASTQSCCIPPTSQQVGVWLTERAQVVEEMTGQLHTAVRLLRLAQDFYPQDILTRQLSTVASLQDGLQEGAMDGEAWGVSLSQFMQLPPHDQVLLLVPEGKLTPDAAAATAHRVAKLVGATVHPKLRHELLTGLIGEEAGRHLPWCAHIFERLRLQRQVFLGRGDMAACALECAYACTTPHHWGALLAILQAGSASLQEQPDTATSHQDLAEQLREAEGRCRAGQLLGALGLDISLPGLRAATPAAAQDLLTLLFRQLANAVPPLSESRWAEVGEEVQEAAAAGLPGLSQEQVHVQLCQALLRSARFNLAKRYLTGGQALPCEVARAVVLQAAQYYFDSATSLEAEEIGLGQVALSLLPHDPEVQQQGMCLQSLQELQDYGLHLLPADYNQVEDKMELLKAALEADPRAHTRPSGVKHLASLLGLKGRSNEVTMCIGQSALAHRNLEAAQQSCVQLIKREHVASWRLCADVMRAGGDEVGSVDTHTMLLSFAAQYARGKKLRGVLAHLRYITHGSQHQSPFSPEESLSPTTSQSSSSGGSMHGGSHRAPARACASPLQIQQMLSKAVNARLPLMLAGRPLPGHGDDQIAVGCLLHLGTEAWPILQGMLEQAPSPAHARRALVMGLKASALKVLMGLPVEGSIQEQSQHMRALWGSHPWDLSHQCDQVKGEDVGPDEQCAQEWCYRFAQQLHSQKDTMQIQEALPDTNLQTFTGSSSESQAFRTEQLSKLASESGQAEDVALGQASLQQALALALKYNCPQWELNFVYANSLLLHWQHSPATVVPLVRQVFPALMEKPYGTVHQLLLCTWPELQGQRQLHIAFCLKLLEMCYKHTLTSTDTFPGPALDQPEASIQQLTQLQSFSRAIGTAAAGLDVKPFLIPYLPAQLLGIILRQTIQEAETGDEGDSRPKISSDAEGVEAGLADVCLAAVEELCAHANSDNVQELVDLIRQLPPPISLGASHTDDTGTLSSSVGVTSSTVYTAAACNVLLDIPNLQPDGQTEACQDVVDFLQQLSADNLTGLLLWAVLQQPHPLLPGGPQLPAQLPEDLRLSLLQAGLQLLHGQADSVSNLNVDSRLESEASRLTVVCHVQQSCELTPEQWGMLEEALEAGNSSPQASAVEQCIGQLLATGLPLEDLLIVTSSLQSHSQTDTTAKQAQSQAAAEVATAVAQQLLRQALPLLSGSSAEASEHVDLANGDSDIHQNGLAQLSELDSPTELMTPVTAEQASDCIRGILHSLQPSGVSQQAQEVVTELRQHVRSTLQHHLMGGDHASSQLRSLQPAQLQLLEVLLGLSSNSQSPHSSLSTGLALATSSSPGRTQKASLVHWEGWVPEQASGDLAQGQQLLLVSHTRAVVKGLWPGVEVGPQDVASLAAAQQLFLGLLDSGHESAQLHGLHGLLVDVWCNGHALDADQAQEEQESGCSSLHSCWSALLERMLTNGHTDAVLRALDAALPSSALLTPQEAHQLVEHSRSMAQAGASAAISLLQSDATLLKSALHNLADKAIVNVVKPDLALLSVLLDKGLFDKVAGGLQAQLLKVLSSDPQPPSLEPYISTPSSAVSCDDIHAESILLPATVSLLTAQGYYAQAAALCMYQTHAHPAFANFESGLQQLQPYLTSFQENSRSNNVTVADVSASWPLPQTLVRVHESMHARFDAALERLKADNYESVI
ncbi:hypothetical protein WJX77_007210 [Trebouxia sp. C0004]